MNNNLPEEHLTRNEQIIRDRNTSGKNAIKQYYRHTKKVVTTPIKFVCECSLLDCREFVEISIDEYEKIHQRKDRFVVAKGHETPIVEKLVSAKPRFHVVEKHTVSS